MDVNDKYLLEITSSAKGINKVAGDLDRLKASLKGFTFSPAKANTFTTFSNSITAFGKAVSNIETGKIMAFSTAMKQLGDVKIKLPSGMDKTVKEIEKAFTGLGDNKELYKKVNSFSRIMKPLSDLKFGGVRGASDAVKGLEKALGSLDFRKIHGEADALNRSLTPLANTLDKIAKASVQVGFNKSFGKGIGNASNALSQALLNGTVNKERAGGARREGSKLTVDSERDITTFRDRIDAVRDAYARANDKFMQFQSNVANGLVKIARFFAPVIKGAKTLASTLGKVGKAIMNLGFMNPFRGVAESITNVIKKVKTLWSSLARIAMYRALRSAIKEIAQAVREGLTNLYYWSQATGGDFAPAVDRLATAFLYLKNSIGASVSPLITYFAPAIDMAIDKVVQFINVINQLFARLTGRGTWTEALRYPTEFAERASGATKKVKDNIQDFDELHILRTDNGGGGASGMDYNNMFRESEFTQGLTEWIEDFKNEIRRGRWYEAGEILAEQINGVIDRVPWARLGDNLASKVNDMFQFAWGVLHNIDFVNIGSSVATFFNHAIENVDAHTIGMVLARKWTMIFDTLYGFVSTFDFPQFGWRVSELVEGWFDEIDGHRIGVTISEAIKGALDSAIAFMSNQSMIDKFAEDFAGLINGIDWYGILVRLLTIGTQVLNAISQAIETAISGGGASTSNRIQSNFQSAPPAIAQRLQAEALGYTGAGGERYFNSANNGSFGDRLTSSMTDSVNSANTSALKDAIVRLLKNVLRAVWEIIKPIAREGSTEIIAEVVDTVQGYHVDAQGNVVSSPFGRLARSILTADSGDSFYGQTLPNALFGRGTRPSSSNNRINSTISTVGATLTGWGAWEDRIESLVFGKNVARADKNLASMDRTVKTLNTDMGRLGGSFTTVNSNVKAFSTESTEGVKSVQTAVETFGNKFSGDVVNRVISSKSTITSTFSSMKDEATNSLSSLTANVMSTMEQTANSVTAPIQGIKGNIVSAFREAGEESARSIGDLSTRMSTSLRALVESSRGQLEGYKGTWQELHSATRGVSNSVIDGSERMANAVTDAFNSLIRNLDGFEIDVPNYKFKSRSKTPLSHITIPRLATGGIATSPTTALIGEAGKEAVLPLENNTDWMNTLADRINGNNGDEVALLREQNDLLRQIASKNVTISSRDVFNAVRDENSDYITRTGQNALAF